MRTRPGRDEKALAAWNGLMLAAFAAPASAQQQDQDWDKVVAAAKKEGVVTVYHAQLGAPHWKKVARIP